MVRGELSVEVGDIWIAVEKGRGGMANWRVDEEIHALNVMVVDEVEGGSTVSTELESWLEDSELMNRVARFMFAAKDAEVNVLCIFLSRF